MQYDNSNILSPSEQYFATYYMFTTASSYVRRNNAEGLQSPNSQKLELTSDITSLLSLGVHTA
jgi:hypothetical protein